MQDEQTGWTVTLNLPAPSLDDNRADADRLKAALSDAFNADAVDIALPLLKKLPTRLREWDYQVRCLCFNDYGLLRLVGIKAPADTSPFYGLAMDLGTTRVVFRLINLDTGEAAAEQAFDNPQIEIGPDILERIHYADTDGGLNRLNELIIGEFQTNIETICRKAGIRGQAVYLMVGSSRVDLQACKLEYSIVSPK